MSEFMPRSECDKHINSMASEIKQVGEKLGNKIDRLALDFAEFPDKFFERADKRYASKTIEKAVYALAGALLIAIFMKLVK